MVAICYISAMSDFSIKQLNENLQSIFQKEARVAAVYLFGSLVQGKVHPKSDIDLAVLISPDKNFGLDDTLNLEVNITLALKTERYDLVILNNASLILRFRVISTGKLIYVANDDFRSEFEEKVMQEYYDFMPRLNDFNREYFSALKENYL